MRYIVSTCDGEELFVVKDKNEALEAAYLEVLQHISDHLRHQLPLKVTPEIAAGIGVEVFPAATNPLVLPLQEWFDEYYQGLQEGDRTSRLQDIKTFLRLGREMGALEPDQFQVLVAELAEGDKAYANDLRTRFTARLKELDEGAPQDG